MSQENVKGQRNRNDAAVVDLHAYMVAKEQRTTLAFQKDAAAYLRDMGFNAVIRTEQHRRGVK